MAEDIKEFLSNYWLPLVGAGFVGFLLRSFWDVRVMTSERLVPVSELVERQMKGRLGRAGQRRLRKLLENTVGDLASRMRPAVRPRDAPECAPKRESVVVVRPGNARGTTLCPSGDVGSSNGGSRTGHVLYLRVDGRPAEGHGGRANSDHVVYGASSRFGDVARDNDKAFLSLPRQDGKRSAWLWVDAAAFMWESAAAANECLGRLQEQVQGKYPGLDVVLEINAAKDVVREFDGRCQTVDGGGKETAHTSPLPQIRYVETRDEVYDFVAGGRAFWGGGDSLSGGAQLVVPQRILAKRAAGLGGALAGDWRCLTIRGPAGVGKTQTARQVVEELCEEHQAIAVELSLSDLDEVGASEPQDADVVATIVRVLKRRLIVMSAEPGNIAVARACADVAAKVVSRERDRMKLVVADDLDSFRGLREWMRRATDRVAAADLNVRLVRVFRRSDGGAESANGEPTLGEWRKLTFHLCATVFYSLRCDAI